MAANRLVGICLFMKALPCDRCSCIRPYLSVGVSAFVQYRVRVCRCFNNTPEHAVYSGLGANIMSRPGRKRVVLASSCTILNSRCVATVVPTNIEGPGRGTSMRNAIKGVTATVVTQYEGSICCSVTRLEGDISSGLSGFGRRTFRGHRNDHCRI